MVDKPLSTIRSILRVKVKGTFPAAEMFRTFTGTLFPVFEISNTTIIMQVLLSLLTGLFAAVFPAWKANTVNIVGALRAS